YQCADSGVSSLLCEPQRPRVFPYTTLFRSPSSSAKNSICRICPTATSVVTSYQRVLFGVGPPSVPVTKNSCPCKWMGWFVIVRLDRKSTRLNSSHVKISYAVFCLKKKKYCS